MNIYTSYYAKIKKIPEGIIPISIALYTPKGIKIDSIPELFPTSKILFDFKNDHDERKYTTNYTEQVLNNLDANEIANKIKTIVNNNGGKDAVLVCYEKSGDFCHRHLVANWLYSNGIECKEYVFE